MSTFRTTAAALLSALLLITVSAAPAQAATARIDDSIRDGWRWTDDGPVRAATWVNVDVRRVTIEHLPGAVVAEARYRDLQRTDARLSFVVSLQTPALVADDDGMTVVVFTTAARPGGRTAFVGYRSGEPIPCTGIRHRVDYATDTIRVRVPRGCLDDPRWVRAHAIARLEVRTPSGALRSFADDGHSTRAYSYSWTRRLGHS